MAILSGSKERNKARTCGELQANPDRPNRLLNQFQSSSIIDLPFPEAEEDAEAEQIVLVLNHHQ